MERPAKILLSPQEMELVNNTDWILTKHVITKKVFEMFGDLSRIINEEIKPYHYLFPENIKHQNGKISKAPRSVKGISRRSISRIISLDCIDRWSRLSILRRQS